jgi:hypothetical protein
MDIAALTLSTINSVAEMIDLADGLEPLVTAVMPARWAYRGQSREYKTLLPSFQRVFTGSPYGAAELIEQELIKAFRSHYTDLRDRSADMPEPRAIGVGYDLRCLAVMQHYEVPTRLLDWTMDFWTSIYFACASDPADNAELWFYDRNMFEPQLSLRNEYRSLLSSDANPPIEPPFLQRGAASPIVELDPKITPRMKQQHGHHTVSTDVFSDHAPLLDHLKTSSTPAPDGGPRFRRYVISSVCKGKTLQFLAAHKNITAGTIFPDVVGLGRFLRWQLDSLKTMLL